jgi:formylglycine-generating enzyme required for sulfatase activity
LVLSARPDLSAGEVEAILKQSAKPIQPRDRRLEFGRVDALEAVRLAKKFRVLNGGVKIPPTLDHPGTDLSMKLMLIPAGVFAMGSPEEEAGDRDERPLRNVVISRPFFLGTTEVTRSQYTALLPTKRREEYEVRLQEQDFKIDQGEKPAVMISWREAVEYCNLLSQDANIDPPFYRIGDSEDDPVEVPDWEGDGYRLPTEAEWEYACRAGSKARFCFGDDEAKLEDWAWYQANASEPQKVGHPSTENNFAIFDMHGNVWEWCWDVYDPDYYARRRDASIARAASPEGRLAFDIDPRGPEGPAPQEEASRVARGGSWRSEAQTLRSANREGDSVGITAGFRVARNVPRKSLVGGTDAK